MIKDNPKKRYFHYFKRQGIEYQKREVQDLINWTYSEWEFIKRKIAMEKRNKILEIGSGLGRFYSYVGKTNDYTGLELDKDAVKFTKKYFNCDYFFNMSFEEFKPTNKFDIVFAFEVLEHLSSPFESVCKIKSLLKKNGLFIGTSPYPYKKFITGDKTHIYVLLPENWKNIFLQAGFSDVRLFPMSFAPFFWRINKKLNFRIPFYLSLTYFVSTCLIIAKK